MSAPRSVRFDDAVLARLERHIKRLDSGSISAVVNRWTDEALRMDEHPGVMFRSGPSGRRAGLVNGPDIEEVVAAYHDVVAEDRSLVGERLIAELGQVTGLGAVHISVALRYYGQYTVEVDARIEANLDQARQHERLWRSEQDLLQRPA